LPVYMLIRAFEALVDNAGEVFVDNETLGRMSCYGSLYDPFVDAQPTLTQGKRSIIIELQ
jgi:hypothetical protein